MAEERKRALLIANYQYDNHITDLKAPQSDIDGLNSVLSDPEIGDFKVFSHIVNEQRPYITTVASLNDEIEQ